MDVIKLLEYLQELLDTASKLPMSNKVVISKKEFNEVIEQIVNYLPDEFKRAQWICEEKEKILKDANEQAEMIKKDSVEIIRKKINNHDYVKEAYTKAEDIVSEATRNGRVIQNGAKDYAGEILINLQNQINITEKTMLDKVKKEMEEFLIEVQTTFNDTLTNVEKDIDQLRNMK